MPGSVSQFLSLFRSSGRFIWPVFYFLVIFAIIVIIRNTRLSGAILFVAVLLQYSDIQPLYQPKKISDIIIYQTPLQSEFWQSAAQTNKHIVIIPARRLRPPYEPFANYALRNKLTLNLGYFARSDTRASEEYSKKVWDELKAGKLDDQTIYILSNPEYITYAKENLANELYIIDKGKLCVIRGRKGKGLYPYREVTEKAPLRKKIALLLKMFQ